MCTVSYIPSIRDHQFVLTSNRDEREYRSTQAPSSHVLNGTELVFPKDGKAGGSWIAVNKKGRICCLLNGAYEVHQKQRHHTLSRGIVLKELTASELPVTEFFNRFHLANVEPFTMVIITYIEGEVLHLEEFIWDGNHKHFQSLNKAIPHLWSSSTLYTKEQKDARNKWFQTFICQTEHKLSYQLINAFHGGTHTEDVSTNLVMKREGGLKTVSITQVYDENNGLVMDYDDLLTLKKYHLEI